MRFFIIGYMASGKTTFGKGLAEEKGIPFLDLDACIEKREGHSIATIFSTNGESCFRELERIVLHALCEDADDFVLATGGGTPCFFDNMDYMNSQGCTLFLETPLPVLVERLKVQRATRPVLAACPDEALEEFIEKHLASRLPFYRKANKRLI